ncbi:MAG: transcriptional repressor [Gammaproteobacteria bacterium]|nr:transcriptional repressor [Gammaproteobacteria bacterium]
MTSVGLERKLRSHGVKPTPQRMQIGEVLLTEPCHMSADQIIKSLKTAGHRVSKATVYNTLNLFSKQGIIREIAIDPTHLVYDSTTGHHHHFYNLDTGELTDIDSPDVCIDGLPELPAGTTQEGLDLIIRIRNQS